MGGPPLADSFVLKEYIRISSKGEGKCHFVIVANVEFLKFSLLKGKIESETWAGVTKRSAIAILVVIIIILLMFILALSRLVTNLERLDERIASIEDLLSSLALPRQ